MTEKILNAIVYLRRAQILDDPLLGFRGDRGTCRNFLLFLFFVSKVFISYGRLSKKNSIATDIGHAGQPIDVFV